MMCIILPLVLTLPDYLKSSLSTLAMVNNISNHWLLSHPCLYQFVLYIYIYRERERERWVQVTPDVTLKSYTFFKPLDLSRSNGQKKTLINANILIKISLIIHHLLYFISISKPKKKCYIWLSLTFLFLSLSPTLLFHLHA